MHKVKDNFFVDTNVFIDYILMNEIFDKLEKSHPLYDMLRPSFEFVEFYLKHKKNVRLCTSFLNLCEMSHVLIEEIVRHHMYAKRIPFSYFELCLKRFLKQKTFKKEAEETIRSYYRFIIDSKIWFIHNIVFDKVEKFKEIDRLRIEFGLPMTDSLIFFLAKKEGGYFVTNDNQHFLGNSQLKKNYNGVIEISSPQKALGILRQTIKK